MSRKASLAGRIGCLAVAILPVALVTCAGMGVYSSWQAEVNLHSTLYVIGLVDHFVQEHDRWPRSWQELEQTPYDGQVPRAVDVGKRTTIIIGGAMEFDWPRQSTDLQRRITIDFAATPEMIVQADVVDFQPIHPNGPYYPYWQYGLIEHLQESVREVQSGSEIR